MVEWKGETVELGLGSYYCRPCSLHLIQPFHHGVMGLVYVPARADYLGPRVVGYLGKHCRWCLVKHVTKMGFSPHSKVHA